MISKDDFSDTVHYWDDEKTQQQYWCAVVNTPDGRQYLTDDGWTWDMHKRKAFDTAYQAASHAYKLKLYLVSVLLCGHAEDYCTPIYCSRYPYGQEEED